MSSPVVASPRAAPALRDCVWGALLFALVALAYAGTFAHAFIWDDDLHVYTNPRIIGPEGLREIWTTAAANYFPLVLTNFWVQHAIWGVNPAGYHVVTVLCHALCALLLWRVLLALGVAELGAWLGAALWALHPVQVESVAWISELKNTQSGIFFLAAILFWLKWLEAGRGLSPTSTADVSGVRPDLRPNRLYALSLFCAVLALLSKPSTVTLPVALALLTWWRRGELRLRALGPIVPFLALSVVASGWAIWEQRVHSGASGAEWNQTFAERLAIAGKTTWFYLWKLVWPWPLVFVYPRWDPTARALAFVPAVAALAAFAVLWWRRTTWRAGFLVAVFFVALLFPVLGFFDVFFFRYSFVGDHFQYLASMGPLALAGAALARRPRRIGVAAAAAVLIVAGFLTVRQARIYANNVALWRATVTDNPRAVMAWLNLADSFSKEGRHPEAIESFRRALKLRPDDPDGHADLGCELVLVGQPADALPEFATALRLRPNNPETHNNLGNALWDLGRREESVAEYQRALELRPDYGVAHNGLGAALAQLGRVSEALPHFAAALRADAKHVEAYDNLGNALRALGRLPEAISAHGQALRLRPNFAEARNNLALDFAASGRLPEAIDSFQQALALRPDSVTAAGGLAKALVASGREDEALRHLKTFVGRAPDSAAAHNNLGSLLAQIGRNDEAIGEFTTAVRLEPDWVMACMNLGTALGTAQRWLDAAKQFETVAKLQPDSADAFAKLGVALVNAERLDTGALSFVRALQLNPKSAELHDQLAQVLNALGRKREALEHMETAARLRREAPRGP